ncbi:MAG: hypothetical protein H6729_02690 [Deltaproteobacteria bacterium]|nr:hypothetical protein [Deltaproteobacteria bacterium]
MPNPTRTPTMPNKTSRPSRAGLTSAIIALFASLVACEPSDAMRHTLRPLSKDAAYAVVLSDRTSTAIALLDAEGEVIDPAWVHSGTTLPGLNAALSGDVSIPSNPDREGQLTLLDRYRADVMSRFDLRSGTLIGQLRLRMSDETEPSFSPNPQDLVFLDTSPRTAWVSRFGITPASSTNTAGELATDLGNDLVEVDTERMVFTGRRHLLTAFDTQVQVHGSGNESGSSSVRTEKVYARPSAVVERKGALVVGLARLSLGFDAAADGVVALFDPTPSPQSKDASPVLGRTLDGLANCGQVTRVPGTDHEVLVSCVGFSHPFGQADRVRETSGFAIFAIEDGALTPVKIWRATDHPEAPNPTANVVAIAPDLIIGIETGQGTTTPNTPDTLYAVDLRTDETHALAASNGAFEIGTPAFSASTGLLLVPDASHGIRRFHFDADKRTFTEQPSLDLGVRDGLPPREVRRLTLD